MTDSDKVISKLKELSDPEHLASFKRFGINGRKALGVRMPEIQQLSKEIGTDQELAETLWFSDIHEAKLLACYLADPTSISEETCHKWANGLYSWDVCDKFCELISRTPFAIPMAFEWCQNENEFVRRAGFAALVTFTIHHKKVPDSEIMIFFEPIAQFAWDDRNFVRKAVSWLLRTIGKRSLFLNGEAIQFAKQLLERPDKSSKWIARDALRELQSEPVRKRLIKKAG